MSFSTWQREVDGKGSKDAILDRIRFHGSCSIRNIILNTGLCKNTVIKHLKRLEEEKKVEFVYVHGKRWVTYV